MMLAASQAQLFSVDTSLFRAFSAKNIYSSPPGALSRAITVRAFGAEISSFHLATATGPDNYCLAAFLS